MRKLPLILVALLGLVSPAVAQIVNKTISSNEVVQVSQGPGGPGGLLSTIRTGNQFAVTSGTGAVTSTAADGVLMWIGTAPSTWVVTTPATPFDGEMIVLSTGTTLTSMVTLTAASGQSLHATYTTQTLTAITPAIFYYRASNTMWYRIQ